MTPLRRLGVKAKMYAPTRVTTAMPTPEVSSIMSGPTLPAHLFPLQAGFSGRRSQTATALLSLRYRRRGYLAHKQAKSMSHGLRRGLGGVPSRKMTIDRHARQAIDECASGKHNMVEIQTVDKLTPLARLGQKLKHPLPDCGVLRPQAIRCLKIDQGARVDDLEMRRVGEGPAQIALTDRF